MMARKRAHRLILGVYFVYLQSLFVREFFCNYVDLAIIPKCYPDWNYEPADHSLFTSSLHGVVPYTL
jgi:hypothetical protein